MGAVRLQDGAGHQRHARRSVGLFPGMDHFYGKQLAFALQDRAVKGLRKGFRVQRGRHNHHPEIFPEQRLALPGKGKGFVGVQAALVEFVENHYAHAFQARVFQQHPGQDALCKHLYPRVPGDFGLEADPVAHGLAQRLFQEPGHPRGHLPGGHPAGLQHQDFPLRKRF